MRENMRTKQIRTVAAVLWLGATSGLCAQPRQDPGRLLGHPAELSAWAYAYRADLKIQEKPEAAFILRRLDRLDRVSPETKMPFFFSSLEARTWP